LAEKKTNDTIRHRKEIIEKKGRKIQYVQKITPFIAFFLAGRRMKGVAGLK
jgi:hypothetical protein